MARKLRGLNAGGQRLTRGLGAKNTSGTRFFRYDLQGAEKLQARLRHMRKVMCNRLKPILKGEMDALVRDAQAKAPKKSGTLKASTFTGTPYVKRGKVGIRGGYTDKKAPAVHEGIHWGKRAETGHKHWFRNALMQFEGAYRNRMRGHIEGLLKEAAQAERQSQG